MRMRGALKLRSVVIVRVLMLAQVLLALPSWASRKTPKVDEPGPPILELEGGRRLTYERSFGSEREVKPKRGFWNRLVDFVAGEPEFKNLVRPYSIAVDSHGRIIVTDPGAGGVHIFDFAQQKYKFIERRDKGKDPMLGPQCVAVDAQDNIYVTDSETGKIFVFNSGGKYERVIGSLKGGEGYFKRPTGIAVDSAAQRIYVTDTLRDEVFMMDMQGSILQTIGKKGSGNLEFNFPTELRIDGQDLIAVDAMNFRIQVLGRDGSFRYAIGKLGDSSGDMFRPKGIGVDSEGDLYIVDGLWGVVQVFNRQGQLLYYFGKRGTQAGEFQLPAGLFIDRDDRIFIVDSYNRRIQVFHYFGLKRSAKEGM
ncbi:MAG: 6-bladed beta-propeller [Terriglobales bacterium]|jgi:DNA-binding beta-propeller fold protein YncE